MTDSPLPFSSRVGLAFATFFRILGDGAFASRVANPVAPSPAALPSAAKETEVTAPAPLEARVRGADDRAALQLLALLQREGRFVDFLEEEVSGFSDAQIGAAARAVHEGCKKVLRDHLPVTPVRAEDEGSRVVLPPGFDASANRLTGNVRGEPPFTGTLQHRGYRVVATKLPKLHDDHDAHVIAPAEIEL